MLGLVQYIFSLDFVATVIRMSTPILFVALGAIIGNKANILCVAFEGMMLFSSLVGTVVSAYADSLIVGMLLGIFASMVIAFIFGYFVLYLDTKPMLIGLALNILGSGGTVFLLYMLTGSKANSLSLVTKVFPTINIPIIKDIPIIGRILSGQNILTYLAFVMVFVVRWFVYKTRLGLEIRAVGENPLAAESVGINVKKTKLIAVLISGFVVAFGGMFLSMGYLTSWTRDNAAGRGFTGMAAQNLGLGEPISTMLCTLFFGAAQAVGNVAQSYRLPSQFAQMLPYVATLIGLMFIGGKKDRKVKPQIKDRSSKL